MIKHVFFIHAHANEPKRVVDSSQFEVCQRLYGGTNEKRIAVGRLNETFIADVKRQH